MADRDPSDVDLTLADVNEAVWDVIGHANEQMEAEQENDETDVSAFWVGVPEGAKQVRDLLDPEKEIEVGDDG